MGLLAAGCSSWPWDRHDRTVEALERARVQDRVRYLAQAAVGRPGAYVCRELSEGIAETDWIRGTVMQADGERIRVKISDPGRYPHQVNGTEIAEGALLWDDDTAWIPCVK